MPEFKGGCPYSRVVPDLKGLKGNSPAFKNGKCPFDNLDGKNVDDTIKKVFIIAEKAGQNSQANFIWTQPNTTSKPTQIMFKSK